MQAAAPVSSYMVGGRSHQPKIKNNIVHEIIPSAVGYILVHINFNDIWFQFVSTVLDVFKQEVYEIHWKYSEEGTKVC